MDVPWQKSWFAYICLSKDEFKGQLKLRAFVIRMLCQNIDANLLLLMNLEKQSWLGIEERGMLGLVCEVFRCLDPKLSQSQRKERIAMSRYLHMFCAGVRNAGYIVRCGVSLLSLSVAAGLPTAMAEESAHVLFEQPALEDVAGNFYVPPATHRPPPNDVFCMILWQPDPATPNGELVALTDWNAGEKTGFYPPQPMRQQAGFANRPNTSAVQVAHDAVGAYLNSADLPNGSDGGLNKMMITPQYTWSAEHRTYPFAQTGKALVLSMQLQIPTANDEGNPHNNTYADVDLLFTDRTSGVKISYGATLFFNRHPVSPSRVAYDQPSNSYMVNSAVAAQNPWITLLPHSAVKQGAPWRGWKNFRYAVSEENFRAALAALKRNYPLINASMKPADYALSQFHLNTEMHFTPRSQVPTELGWSMRKARITLQDLDAYPD